MSARGGGTISSSGLASTTGAFVGVLGPVLQRCGFLLPQNGDKVAERRGCDCRLWQEQKGMRRVVLNRVQIFLFGTGNSS